MLCWSSMTSLWNTTYTDRSVIAAFCMIPAKDIKDFNLVKQCNRISLRDVISQMNHVSARLNYVPALRSYRQTLLMGHSWLTLVCQFCYLSQNNHVAEITISIYQYICHMSNITCYFINWKHSTIIIFWQGNWTPSDECINVWVNCLADCLIYVKHSILSSHY